MADKWKSVRDGLDKWMRLACYIFGVCLLLDVLPHLPDALAKRIVDKLLGLIGLGD